MPKLPAFVSKKKGPLTLAEHEKLISRRPLKSIWSGVEEFFGEFGFVLRARFQSWGPCVYVFYNQAALEDNQQGLILRCQDLPSGGGFEVLFNKFDGSIPISMDVWEELPQDRYKAQEDWKAFSIKIHRQQELDKGLELVAEAKANFEKIFALELEKYR